MSTYTEAQGRAATIKVLEFVLTIGAHDLALTALLSAYTTIASHSPCCVKACAHATGRVSEMLTDIATVNDAIKH